jgi:hypothetical protein
MYSSKIECVGCVFSRLGYSSCVHNIVDCRKESDWWTAQHLQTFDEGMIPSNYVVEDTAAPEAQESVYTYTGNQLNLSSHHGR